MKLLAIDTSTELCSVSLFDHGNIIEKQQFAEQQHAELIFQMLRELFAESGYSLQQMDCLAFGKGPGSFTGLRIATGVIQGLALGADLPVVSVSTLETIAVQAKSSYVIACLDARIGELYSALYHFEDINQVNSVKTLIEPHIDKPDTILAPQNLSDEWIGCGTGFNAYPQLIQHHQWIKSIQSDNLYPKASTIAYIASQRQEQKVSAELALPVYIRDKVALTTKERSSK